MMDRLYELAFALKKAKPWKTLKELDLFAVQLSGNRKGYINLTGLDGAHQTLVVFVGEEHLQGYFELCRPVNLTLNPFAQHEMVLRQHFLQCGFFDKSELTDYAAERVRAYARAHGIRLAGSGAFPQFLVSEPYKSLRIISEEEQQEDLCAALAAAIEMVRRLKAEPGKAIGATEVGEDGGFSIPLLIPEGDGYRLTDTRVVPAHDVLTEREYPEPKVTNEIAMARLKRMQKSGVWACEIIYFPYPVMDEESEEETDDVSNEEARFPVMAFAIEEESDYVLPTSPEMEYETNPEPLLNQFIDSFLEQQICPAGIDVRDLRTYRFMKDFCEKGGIRLRWVEADELEALDAALAELWHNFSGEDAMETAVQEMLEDLLAMPQEYWDDMPDTMKDNFMEMAEQELLPPDMAAEIKRRIHRK